MSDIQRYSCYRKDINLGECPDGDLVLYSDHLKAISKLSYELNMSLSREQEQDKAIEANKTYISGMEGIVKEQTKEIERLKDGISRVYRARHMRDAHKYIEDISWEHDELTKASKELTK